MTFDDVLVQVVDLLQRQGRVSYRALKRRFALDDDYLEDLKAELIKAQRLAVDEDGEVLVWTGIPGTAPPLSPKLPQREQPQAPHEDRSTQTVSPSAEPRAPQAERRQLTVLFCDLVDSTALAARLDPEEWREVVRAYQATCAKVMARYEGHITQYLGDGLLVYFGYPLAHEDDAQRAVRSGLGIVEAVGRLNPRLMRERSVELAVRLGIHTGEDGRWPSRGREKMGLRRCARVWPPGSPREPRRSDHIFWRCWPKGMGKQDGPWKDCTCWPRR
jgi:hypothetical protein